MSNETKTVKISKATHKEVKDFVGTKTKIGAFIDEAALEKIKKEKQKK